MARQKLHNYTAEEYQFIANNIPGRSNREMTNLFNAQFGTSLAESQMKSAITRRKLKSGVDARFKPGNISWTTGKKGLRLSPQTEFKKGQMPHNHKPVGSERLSKDGYLEIKITEPKTWKAKHRIVWEAVNGPVPKGHALIFADGNKSNISLANLLLVSRSELLIINRQGLIFNREELTASGVAIAKLLDKTNKKMRDKGAMICCNMTDL